MNTSKHTPKKPKELDLRYAKPEAQAYVREQAIRLHHEGWTALVAWLLNGCRFQPNGFTA